MRKALIGGICLIGIQAGCAKIDTSANNYKNKQIDDVGIKPANSGDDTKTSRISDTDPDANIADDTNFDPITDAGVAPEHETDTHAEQERTSSPGRNNMTRAMNGDSLRAT